MWWTAPAGLWCVGLDAGMPKFRRFLSHWLLEAARMHPWEDSVCPFPASARWVLWDLVPPACTAQEPSAFPQRHFGGWDTPLLPNSAQGSAPAALYMASHSGSWNSPLLDPEITADLPRGEIPAWKMRTTLRAETSDKGTRSGGYFPSCARLALHLILRESFQVFAS